MDEETSPHEDSPKQETDNAIQRAHDAGYTDVLDERYVATLDYNSPNQVELRKTEDEKRAKEAKKIARKLLRRKKLGRTAMPVNRFAFAKDPPHQDVYKLVDEHLAPHGIDTEVYSVVPWTEDYDIPHHIIRIRTKNGQEVPESRYFSRRISNGGLGGAKKVHPPEETKN
jgi:hypothetical protein